MAGDNPYTTESVMRTLNHVAKPVGQSFPVTVSDAFVALEESMNSGTDAKLTSEQARQIIADREKLEREVRELRLQAKRCSCKWV